MREIRVYPAGIQDYIADRLGQERGRLKDEEKISVERFSLTRPPQPFASLVVL